MSSSVTRYRARVAYDGTDYYGFQRQLPAFPTVQGAIEDALAELNKQKPVTVLGAGRTDAGVHAVGQVIAFDLAWRHGAATLQRALNARLPRDISVEAVVEAPAAFHPRFDARRRRYAYTVLNTDVRRPEARHRSWHVRQTLDVVHMAHAAAYLVGRHDFATFGRPPQGENTVRDVYQASWRRQAEWLTFTIEANAFLQRMVRSIVGSLRLVGDGRWTVADFVDALNARDRSRAGEAAPPQGLCLASVLYENE